MDPMPQQPPLGNKAKVEIIFDAKDVSVNFSHPIVSQHQKNLVLKALIAAMNAIIDNPLPVVLPAGMVPNNGHGRLPN